MKSTGARSSNELQKLDYMTGDQDISPSKGSQTCRIDGLVQTCRFVWILYFWSCKQVLIHNRCNIACSLTTPWLFTTSTNQYWLAQRIGLVAYMETRIQRLFALADMLPMCFRSHPCGCVISRGTWAWSISCSRYHRWTSTSQTTTVGLCMILSSRDIISMFLQIQRCYLILYSALAIYRSHFSLHNSPKTPHTSPLRVSYGVSLSFLSANLTEISSL